MSEKFLCAFACAALVAVLVVVLPPAVFRWRESVRARDAQARVNRRRREIREAEWRHVERRADLMAGIHRKMRGIS